MLTSLDIRNFKSFSKAKVKFSTLNLLTGINGVGKSTIIQVLLLLRQSFFQNVFPDKGVLLNGNLFNLGKGSDALNIHSELAEIFFGLHFKDLPEMQVTLQFEADIDLLPLVKEKTKIDKSVFNHPLFTNHFKYLNAERVPPRVSYEASLFEVEQNRSLGINGEYTSLFLAKFQRIPVKIRALLHESTTTNTLIEQVSAWLRDISPGINLKPLYYPEIDSAKLSFQYEYGDLTTPDFRPTNVGFGITYVLPIITSLLSAEVGDIVVIENPESHLHPSGQFKLGELLFKSALGGIQTIVETHSDHVLNGIRVAVNKHKKNASLVNLIYFSRNLHDWKHNSTLKIPKLDNRGRIDSWPDGFFDEWDKSLIQLI